MGNSLEAMRAALYDHILNAQRDKAGEMLSAAAAELGFKVVIRDVLEPVLVDIGERWWREELSLAQGYVAGKIAEDLLLKASQAAPVAAGHRKGPVVLGNIEDDHHALGRRLVAIFLEAAGWEVLDLGNDVPAQEFVDRAVESGARVIGVSAMMLTTAEGIRRIRELLDERALSGRVQLAIGGAVINLRPELVQELGGDGTCANAIQAPELFEALWQRSLAHGQDSA